MVEMKEELSRLRAAPQEHCQVGAWRRGEA